MRQREPIFNVPFCVIALIGVMIAIHLVRQFLSPLNDEWFVNLLAFNPARYGQAFMLFNLSMAGGDGFQIPISHRVIPGGDVAAFTSFVSHMLVHGDLTHLAFNCAWFLACGGAIALRVGCARFIGFTIVTGVAGALAFLFLNIGNSVPVVGASGAISGLMAALLRLIFSAVDQGNVAALRYAPQTVQLTPISRALRDPRVLAVTALWMLLNGFSAFGFGGAQDAGAIAWEAHLGGFLAGMFLFGAFDFDQQNTQPYLH